MLARSLIALAAVLVSGSALACDRDPWDVVGYPSGSFFARAMMREATFVDVALAEERRPFLAEPFVVELAAFRTIQRLKGGSPDVFTLLAPGAAGGPQPPKDRPEEFGMYVDAQGRIYPVAARGELDVPFAQAQSSCHPGWITPEPGQLYVVFRGADGRLLRHARYYGDKEQPALPFRMRNAADPAWDVAVGGAAALWWKEENGKSLERSEPKRDDVARLTFKRPVSAAEALKTLGSAGPLPFAVRLSGGNGYTEESRVPPAYASRKLIERSVRDGQAALDRWFGPALAGRLVAGIPEGDPGHSVLGEGLGLLAAARRLDAARGGRLGIASVELIGTPDQWRVLRRSPLVASVETGMTVDGRPAAPPVTRRHVPEGVDGFNGSIAAVVSDLRALSAQR